MPLQGSPGSREMSLCRRPKHQFFSLFLCCGCSAKPEGQKLQEENLLHIWASCLWTPPTVALLPYVLKENGKVCRLHCYHRHHHRHHHLPIWKQFHSQKALRMVAFKYPVIKNVLQWVTPSPHSSKRRVRLCCPNRAGLDCTAMRGNRGKILCIYTDFSVLVTFELKIKHLFHKLSI